MAKASGPDISFYQDDNTTPQSINFDKMKTRSDFVIIRVGQNTWIDSDFKQNWRDAKKAGLPRGSYWFYDSRAEPKRQAELWRDTLGDDQGELPLFADFEENYKGAYRGWQKWYAFLEHLKDLMPKKEIVVYTNYYYWRDNAPNATANPGSLKYFHQYPLWLAQYQVNKPSIPAPWSQDEWLFWQYTEHGDGPGYGVESGGIDLNYFNGNTEDFLKRFNLSDEPVGAISYKVDLSLRQEPNTAANSVGVLRNNEIVERLDTSGDWLKVKRKDGQKGWISKQYLIVEDSPVPEPSPDPIPDPVPDPIPDPVPDPDDGKWYKVTVYALNIRKGPATSYEVLGTVKKDEIVEKIKATSNGEWFEIRSSQNIVGWVYAQNLIETDEPAPVDPDLGNLYLGRHQVTTYSLRVRKGPGTSHATVGSVKRDDIVEVLSANEAGDWREIKKGDLVGWSSAKYLTRYPPRTAVNKNYFNGSLRYIRKIYETPRKMNVHVFVVDMKTKLKFLVTPPKHNSDLAPLCTQTTSEFMAQQGVQIAINGDAFKYAEASNLSCPEGSVLVDPISYAASRGQIYSQRLDNRPIIYINKDNEVSYNEPKGEVYNALSGDLTLVKKGKPAAGLDSTTLKPRTAIGTNQDGRWMVMIVVDGKQPGYSEGCTLTELADMLIKFGGVYDAINLDGDNSSTIVIEKNGKPFLLNSPIEDGTGGKERSVANHLGVEIG